MVNAYSIARKKIFYCSPDDRVQGIADFMQEKNVGSVMVREKDGKVSGIITVGDILRLVARRNDISRVTAKEIMSSPVISISKDADMDTLISKFRDNRVTRLLLTNEKGEYVGVVRDIAAYKYIAFVKFDEEAKDRFGKNYFNELY